jgi:hypothetical protein
MKTYVNLRHLAEFFLDWGMFLNSRTENQNSHFIINNFYPRKSCRLRNNVEKYGGARQATDDNKIGQGKA